MSNTYTDQFFDRFVDGSMRSARIVLPALFERLPVASVADVGCGLGVWLAVARELGVQSILGIDGRHSQARTRILAANEFLACDLEGEFAERVIAVSTCRFDLVLSLEVAEHLSYDAAGRFVAQLTSLSDTVLFSAAVPFQGGVQHVNEQWPEFWALHFRALGYACVDAFRWRFWSAPEVEWWYAQNLLLFVRADTSAARRLNASLDDTPRSLAAVHPRNYLSQVLRYAWPGHRVVHDEEFHDLGALVESWTGGRTSVPPLRAPARAVSSTGNIDVFPHTRVEPVDSGSHVTPERLSLRIAQLERELELLRTLLRQT